MGLLSETRWRRGRSVGAGRWGGCWGGQGRKARVLAVPQTSYRSADSRRALYLSKQESVDQGAQSCGEGSPEIGHLKLREDKGDLGSGRQGSQGSVGRSWSTEVIRRLVCGGRPGIEPPESRP